MASNNATAEPILRQFHVTKLRSWRTGYPRRLVLYANDFCTLDGTKETNRWSYGSIQDAMVVENAAILIDVGTDKLKFQCNNANASIVLSALLQQQAASGQAGQLQRLPLFPNCMRWKRNGLQQSVVLQIQPFGLTELDSASRLTLQTYAYTDLAGLSFPKDGPPETLVLQFRSHKTLLYTLAPNTRAAVVQTIQTAARRCLVESALPMLPSRTIAEWKSLRQRNSCGSSSTVFWVTKPPSPRRPAAVPRQLVVAPPFVVERDTGGQVVSQRPLSALRAIVVVSGSVQLEFANYTSRLYHMREQRDALCVSLWDAAPWAVIAPVSTVPYRMEWTTAQSTGPAPAVAAAAAANVFAATPVPVQLLQNVQQQATHVWAILSGEFASAVDAGQADEQIHSYLHGLCESAPGLDLLTACREFAFSAAVVDTVKVPVLQALAGIAVQVLQLSSTDTASNTAQQKKRYEFVAGLLDVLQRLLRVDPKAGAELEFLRTNVVLICSIPDLLCQLYGLQVLQAILTGAEQQERDMETEFVNKNVMLQSGGKPLMDSLVNVLDVASSSDLILMVGTDIVQSLLCSHQDTTSPEHFAALLDCLATRESALLASLRSPTPYVLENTALLLHLLSQHPVADSIREAALSSGLVLEHFYKGVFSPIEGQRFLSRYLCSQWLTKRLLQRMVPAGFLSYLHMPTIGRVEEEQLDALERGAIEGANNTSSSMDAVGGGTNTARLRTRMAAVGVKSTENFRILFHVLTQDSNLADLIWNTQTRRELRITLESELELLRREEGNAIAWNHQQFKVLYPSLDSEVNVGGVYMRLWLQAGDGFIRSWEEPVRLFEHLFRRFLCEVDRNVTVTVMCIRCLERLYAIHADKIGPFTDMMILVQSMAATKSVETQHRLLGLVASILGVDGIPENAEQLLNPESISQLCQFVAWGHTTGDQVGNMLTRVLGSEGRPMLTDGSGQGPTSNDGEAAAPSAAVAGDISCPAVWFVASTGRVPPPPETVRGPFRVSDLVNMMEAGELSQFDLVTSCQVEEYDLDGGSTDAQVDTGKWKRLNQVWQLRWQLCTDGTKSEIYSPTDVALLAVKALTRLVDLHQTLDPRGVPYFPIPIAKRILSGSSKTTGSEESNTVSNPFPILCQSLLCNDSRIVEQASRLISKLCVHNARATAKLYLTGVYFFALNYTGSNFKSLAELLHGTHLNQHFRSGFAAAANKDELPMRERSVLGNLLPEGLLYILTNYGFERFSEIFIANADTPEVIWTFEMRKHLIEMIRQHLGDFPLRLFQNNTTEYEYCPMPGVAYKRLEEEIFCHNYYLRNLCDEERFPDWPISEPVEVFRACLQYFKKEIDRDGNAEEEKLEQARLVLNLVAGDGSKELRKAYRALARKFHPDKNPAGRETFEKIQTSYELLLPFIERGEQIRVFVEGGDGSLTGENEVGYFPTSKLQMKTMHLLIKAQLLICRRFENEMSRLKYPAYAVLLECIKFTAIPDECSDRDILDHAFAKEERAAFVKSAIELVYRTCLISPENAQGLVSENGVVLLGNLLDFYIRLAIVQKSSEERSVALLSVIADIVAFTVHTLSGVAYYESGRESIKNLQLLNQLLMNWQHCVTGALFSSNSTRVFDALIKRHAIEGISNFAKDKVLQDGLVGCGILWPLLRYLLVFDPTLEQTTGTLDDQDDIAASLASTNIEARLAVRGLGCLSGQFGECPQNDEVLQALNSMLTPPITRMLRNKRSGSVLQFLNTNVERADIIWNIQMRNQLESLLDRIAKDRPNALFQSVSDELKPVSDFQFEALANEVRLGGVYVRFFNKGGSESLAHVEDAVAFFSSLIHFIGGCLNLSFSNQPDWIALSVSQSPLTEETPTKVEDSKFLLALEALRILCRVDGLPESSLGHCGGRFPSILLSLLELPINSQTFEVAGDILYVLSSREYFADAVVNENSLWRLLVVLERTEPSESAESNNESSISRRKSQAWSVLEALSSSPSIANKILASSCWIELLGVLVGYALFTKVWVARLGAAKSVSRLLWDPKTGALADSLLRRFLPPTLIVGLKDDSEAMVKSFDKTSDTPELIWDNDMRAELRKVIGNQLDLILKMRAAGDDAHTRYELPPGLCVRYATIENELNIGGVYVSRFLKEPTYNLRDPGAFLELLLQRWGKELEAYVSPEQQSPTGSTTAVAEAGQDVLDLVTTASVYVCRVREALCEKLASWGYMANCVLFLEQVIERTLFGSPLLAVIRILHVASNQKTNIESLALAGHSDGRHGVVEFTMKAIECNGLHDDAAFMVEFLKKSFDVALGDLNHKVQSSFAMAPSPAPGEGPVRRKVNIGDDPLGMFQSSQPVQMTTTPAFNGNQVNSQNQAVPHSHPSLQSSAHSTTQPAFISNNPQHGQLHQNPLAQQAPQMSNGYSPQHFQHQAQPQASFQQLSQGYPQHTFQQMPQGTPIQNQIRQQQQPHLTGNVIQPQQQSFPVQQFQHPLSGGGSDQVREFGRAKAAQQADYQQKMAEIQRQKEAREKNTFRKFVSDGKQGLSTLKGSVTHASSSLFSGNGAQPTNAPSMGSQAPGASSQQFQRPNFQSTSMQQKPTGIPHMSQQIQSNGAAPTINQPQQQQQFSPPGHHALAQQAPAQSPPQQQFPNAHFAPAHPHHQSRGAAVQGAPQHQNSQSMTQQRQLPGYQNPQYGVPNQMHHQVNASATHNLPGAQTSQGYQGMMQSSMPNPGLNQPQMTSNPASMYNHMGAQQQSSIPNQIQNGNPMNANVGPQYPQQPGPYAPGTAVETVDESADQMHLQQQEPSVMEGSGIDARTPEDPNMAAERQSTTVSGAPGSAQGRVSLLQQAIACNLCEFLVNQVLENPKLDKIRDTAGAKVHSIELLKMLSKDPGFGAKFKMILNEIPAWKKYKSQDHSLLITSHEQKADYFLTNGSSAETKMLTES